MSLLIIVVGLLGLAGLQVRIQQAEFESYQRAQALVLLQDMVERIHQQRFVAACFRFTTDTVNGTPYLGTGATATPACSLSAVSNDNTQAVSSLTEWNSWLQGAAETKGGAAAGAMVGARGCVSYGAGTELQNPPGTPLPDTGIYTVAISWQGTIDTFAPTDNCANGLYGAETRRRVVTTTFRLAQLR